MATKTKINKRDRKAILERQHSLCACCRSSFSITDQLYYDSKANALLCAKCWFYVIHTRSAIEHGTIELVLEYIKRTTTDTQPTI